jgi:signal peptidase
MNRLLHDIGIGLQAILWIVLVAFVVLVALPRVTPFDVLVVRGGSMEPVIHVGSVIVIDRRAQNPSIGDVASFREPSGEIITHRVVALDTGRYVTKGDANRTSDLDHRTRNQVIGTEIATVPFIGYGVHLLQQPVIFLLLLLTTGGYLIVNELRVIAREIGAMRRKRLGDER